MGGDVDKMVASDQIDDIIKKYAGWRGEILQNLRTVIVQADSRVIEGIKWRAPSRPEGLPAWSYEGVICIAEVWKDNVKLVFFKGAQLKDPRGLFNARLNSATDRAVEFKEGDTVDGASLRGLIKDAIEANEASLS